MWNRRLSWFRYETFITFFKFRFSTWGERDNLSMLTVHPSSALNSLTQPTRMHPLHHNWTGLTQVQKSTRFIKVQISTHCFYSKSLSIPAHCFQAWCHSHPQSDFLSGVFIVTSVIVAWTPALMSAPTHALSRKVINLTKPKDKIYKTKNDNIKKILLQLYNNCKHFLTKMCSSIHITHSVNLTWFALLSHQKFHDRPLFKPPSFRIASKQICRVYIYGRKKFF